MGIIRHPRLGVPNGRSRKARPVIQTLRAISVPIPPPEKGQPVAAVIAILAREENPQQAETPIQWILLTNRTAETLEQAQQMLDCYFCCWQVGPFSKF